MVSNGKDSAPTCPQVGNNVSWSSVHLRLVNLLLGVWPISHYHTLYIGAYDWSSSHLSRGQSSEHVSCSLLLWKDLVDCHGYLGLWQPESLLSHQFFCHDLQLGCHLCLFEPLISKKLSRNLLWPCNQDGSKTADWPI